MEFWLAPLHGITHYHFRNCLNRHVEGISVAVTPFLPVEAAGRLNGKKWVDIQPDNNVGLDIIPQLIGNTPSHFVDTIRALQGWVTSVLTGISGALQRKWCENAAVVELCLIRKWWKRLSVRWLTKQPVAFQSKCVWG